MCFWQQRRTTRARCGPMMWSNFGGLGRVLLARNSTFYRYYEPNLLALICITSCQAAPRSAYKIACRKLPLHSSPVQYCDGSEEALLSTSIAYRGELGVPIVRIM